MNVAKGVRLFSEGAQHATEIRPLGHLFKQGLIAVLAFFLPLFAVLYWLTIPRGLWLPVLIVQLITSSCILYAVYAHNHAKIVVSPLEITERGFFGRTTRYCTAAVDSIMILEMYQSDTLDTHAHLFVRKPNGTVALRMRGQFWARDDMEKVIDELAAPVIRVAEPVTLRDLNRTNPELLYWFERRPVGRSRRYDGLSG